MISGPVTRTKIVVEKRLFFCLKRSKRSSGHFRRIVLYTVNCERKIRKQKMIKIRIPTEGS